MLLNYIIALRVALTEPVYNNKMVNKRGSTWIWILIILILVVGGVIIWFLVSGGGEVGGLFGEKIPTPPPLPE